MSKLYNAKGVAEALGYGYSTIMAMKKAGLKFSHGLRTELATVKDWVRDNPGFRVRQAYPQKAQPARQSSASRPEVLVSASADTHGEPLLTHG